MSRLALTILIFSSLLSCAGPPQPTAQNFTVRPIGMTSQQFIAAADRHLLQRVPHWVAPRTHEVDVTMSWRDTGRYAGMRKNDDGTYTIRVERPALALATIEDMAHVLLHEYIHVIVHDSIYAMDLTKQCKELRSEMVANQILIEKYHVIGYRRRLLTQAVVLYAKSKAQARIACPLNAYADLPYYPIPQRVKKRSINRNEEIIRMEEEKERQIQEERDRRIQVPEGNGRYQR